MESRVLNFVDALQVAEAILSSGITISNLQDGYPHTSFKLLSTSLLPEKFALVTSLLLGKSVKDALRLSPKRLYVEVTDSIVANNLLQLCSYYRRN